MLRQLMIGAMLVGVSAVVQAVFMLTAFRALQALRTHERHFAHHHATLIIAVFVLYMFLAMIVHVSVWAGMYYWSGAIPKFEDALYVSTNSFTTIGFGDIHIGPEWRLLVALEGGNGMIIFGWATALIIAAIQHFDVWPHIRPPGTHPAH